MTNHLSFQTIHLVTVRVVFQSSRGSPLVSLLKVPNVEDLILLLLLALLLAFDWLTVHVHARPHYLLIQYACQT